MQVPMTPKPIPDRAVKLYPKKTAVADGDIYAEPQCQDSFPTQIRYNGTAQDCSIKKAAQFNVQCVQNTAERYSFLIS